MDSLTLSLERMVENWPIYWLAILAGALFGFFYVTKVPLAAPHRQVLVGAVVFFTLHAALFTNYVVAVVQGHRTLDDALFLILSPSARWWLFIFTSALVIYMMERRRRVRNKDDC